MTGRGVDQILRHPSSPTLYEPFVASAIDYVAIGEDVHGPIPRSVDDTYVWGVALAELDRRQPSARIVNLETSVTTSDQAAPKGINYRMHPANVGVLSAARVDCAVLANNHVLDWGVQGLCETMDTLAAAGIRVAGAGRSRATAEAPAIIPVDQDHRVLVFAFGGHDSGVPAAWQASGAQAGVSWLGDYSMRTVAHVAKIVRAYKRSGDVIVASIHWGSNWGYEIPHDHRAFAHGLIDKAAVDVVYGHSSHHAKAIEVYRERPILYGCGDFINDYEGILDRKHPRHDLPLMYFPTLDAANGALIALEMVPLSIRRFTLQRPSSSDVVWLRDIMDRECRRFGAGVETRDGRLFLDWHV
jgi:poly-gamma-glutamate capsule biosynthesis protein CapA/YwtB (metallophosphatase superfamily)